MVNFNDISTGSSMNNHQVMLKPPPRQTESIQATYHVAIDVVGHKNNLGPTIRCLVAFGGRRLLLVCPRRTRFSTHGAFGSAKHIITSSYSSWEELRQNMKAQGFYIIGIAREHCKDQKDTEERQSFQSIPVQDRPFQGPTVFITGSKHESLTKEQYAVCDALVHVPIHQKWSHVFHSGSVHLSNDVALSITLHHFTSWAQCQEHKFHGNKYILSHNVRSGQVDDQTRQTLQEERRRWRDNSDVLENEDISAIGTLMMDEADDY